MDIAIPRSHAPDEHRVALTPAGVHSLIVAGHTVFVESGAGDSAGFTDASYSAVGAHIAYGPEEIYARGDLLLTVDGVPDHALPMVRSGQIVCGFLHLSVMPRRIIDSLAAAGASTLSYEAIRRDDGIAPVLLPMSEICGRLMPQLAAHLLETPSGGRGTLLAPVPGVPSAEVVILGAGRVGGNAAYGFSSWGVQTTVLDQDGTAARGRADLSRARHDAAGDRERAGACVAFCRCGCWSSEDAVWSCAKTGKRRDGGDDEATQRHYRCGD